jgi:hypothetical protein
MYYLLFTKRSYNKYSIFTAWTKSKKLIKKVYKYRKDIGIECYIGVVEKQDAMFQIDNQLKNVNIIYGLNILDTESSYASFTESFQEIILPSILDSLYTLSSGLGYLRDSSISDSVDLLRWSILDGLDNGPTFLGDKTFFSDIYKLNIEELYNEYLRGEWS